MFSRFEYLLVIALIWVPTLLLSLHPKSDVKGKIKPMVIAICTTAIPFILWDFFATWRGHWSFSPDYTTGIKIGNLPLAEVLFFFAVPYSCLYTWNVVRDFVSFKELIQKLIRPSV